MAASKPIYIEQMYADEQKNPRLVILISKHKCSCYPVHDVSFLDASAVCNRAESGGKQEGEGNSPGKSSSIRGNVPAASTASATSAAAHITQLARLGSWSRQQPRCAHRSAITLRALVEGWARASRTSCWWRAMVKGEPGHGRAAAPHVRIAASVAFCVYASAGKWARAR